MRSIGVAGAAADGVRGLRLAGGGAVRTGCGRAPGAGGRPRTARIRTARTACADVAGRGLGRRSVGRRPARGRVVGRRHHDGALQDPVPRPLGTETGAPEEVVVRLLPRLVPDAGRGGRPAPSPASTRAGARALVRASGGAVARGLSPVPVPACRWGGPRARTASASGAPVGAAPAESGAPAGGAVAASGIPAPGAGPARRVGQDRRTRPAQAAAQLLHRRPRGRHCRRRRTRCHRLRRVAAAACCGVAAAAGAARLRPPPAEGRSRGPAGSGG